MAAYISLFNYHASQAFEKTNLNEIQVTKKLFEWNVALCLFFDQQLTLRAGLTKFVISINQEHQN